MIDLDDESFDMNNIERLNRRVTFAKVKKDENGAKNGSSVQRFVFNMCLSCDWYVISMCLCCDWYVFDVS